MSRARWLTAATLSCLGAVLSAVPGTFAAHAQQAPPAPNPASAIDAEIAAAQKLMSAGRWQEARAAWTVLLASRPNDPTLCARLVEIEDGLRRSSFRAQWTGVDMKAALGPATVRFNPGTRVAEFETTLERAADGWSGDARYRVFRHPFENEVAIEFKWTFLIVDAIHPAPTVIVAQDPEKGGGCSLRVTAWQRKGEKDGWFGGEIRKYVDKSQLEIGTGTGFAIPWQKASEAVVRYERGSASLSVRLGGREVARASDTSMRSGYIAVVCGSRHTPQSMRIVGRLSDTYLRGVAAEAENSALRDWEDRVWSPAAAMPQWVHDAERRAAERLEELPPAAKSDARRTAAERVRRFHEGDANSLDGIRGIWEELDPATQRYISALEFQRNGDWRSSAAEFALLGAEAPEFVPAITGLAWAQFKLGRASEASSSVSAALNADPSFAPTHELRAAMALSQGDAESARAALSLAALHGVLTPSIRMFSAALLRLERGPDWTKRFEHQTANFDVASDHSVITCMEVGKQLEDARAAYQARFRAVPATGRRAKVYVFSGNEGYLDYAADVGADLRNTLGVYMPLTRQLAVFLHDDRVELWNTVRHEAFHQYLHQIADDVPLWFDEGYAEFFGFSRRKFGKTVTGQADGTQVAAIRMFRPSFAPLSQLLRMERAPFMRKPEVHYVQSWSVIHFLRETKNPALKGVLDRYLDALIAGKGRADAYREVIEPVFPLLEQEWREHLDDFGQ